MGSHRRKATYPLDFLRFKVHESQMDELIQRIHALRERSDEVMVSFLWTDLEMADTFYRLAKSSEDPNLLSKNLRAARIAVETVSKFIWKANLTPRELDHLTAQIERLKFELENVRPKTADTLHR